MEQGIEVSHGLLHSQPSLLVWDLVQCELIGLITITQGLAVTLETVHGVE